MVLAAVAIAAAIVIASLGVVGDEADPQAAAPSPTPSSAPVAAPTTGRTPIPNILGAASTSLLLWSFDSQSRLQVLDLDSGELRPLGPKGGYALLPLLRNVVIFDGDNGSSVVSAIGATSTENLGPGAFPIVERDSRKLWVLSDDVPRRWQLRAVDGTILDVLPFESNVAPVAFSSRAVMLVSIQGTWLFDLVTREQQMLTSARVIAAGGPNLISRSCSGQLCTFTVIDIETRRERVLLRDLPVDDANNASLSPDGAYLAITAKTPEASRHAEIVSVSTGMTVWKSPAGAYSSGAWSWSPDSKWLFVTMSGRQVLAVRARGPWAETAIPLSLIPLHGIAVTYR